MKDTTQFGGFLFLLSLIGLCWTSVASADDNNKVDVNTTGSQSNDSLVFNLTQIGYNNGRP